MVPYEFLMFEILGHPTPGTHDIIHGSLSLFAWTLGAVFVVVFLWVTYKKGQSALAAQLPKQQHQQPNAKAATLAAPASSAGKLLAVT